MFSAIVDKVTAGTPLSEEEGLYLADPGVSLHRVGSLADSLRRRLNGRVAWYNINTHLNPTNICKNECPMCAFHAAPGHARGYVLPLERMLERANEAADAGCTEMHIVGGMHPELPYAWYRELIASIHRACPTLHLKAWTAPEILHFADISGKSVREVLEEMKSLGVTGMPGGGAEIFAESPRRKVAPKKIGAEAWLDVHRTAHRLGLPTNATMLFGHFESVRDRIDHLLQLRRLQAESLVRSGTGFVAFVPLLYQPHQGLETVPIGSPEILRTIALSRLMLDNVPHIKAYWVSLGIGPAQTALGYGADDFDGTVHGERIHHAAGSVSPTSLSVEEILHLIAETGCEPIERDSLYRRVVR